MVSIVYEHCMDLQVPGDTSHSTNANGHYVTNVSQALAMPWIVQPMKFGTLCFFIISGYLLGKHLLLQSSPWTYYKRRLQVVGIPFIIALGLFMSKHLGVFGLLIGRYDISMLTPEFLKLKISVILFNSAYWFVFNFLIVLGLFLVFWRHSYKPIFGWITGAIAVFYGINIYFGWVEQRHNLVIAPYLFYLWLGVWLSRRQDVLDYLQRLPNRWLIGAVLLSLGLAISESRYLWSPDTISPFNSLRLSNQLFSVLVFVLLLRNDFSNRLTWINPRTESFGIYLYHLYFVQIANAIFISLNILTYSVNLSGLQLAAVTLIRFFVIYSSTLLFVKLINKTRFKWLFGN
ncbi:hypothetical protein CWM47_23545 [Spirosoma pollinicola]|uniref:Acyltransferase 3 domain-containing protein n=2 Tax=Spirosoma pollinicola TaxID=2057025 RepID=A0A2K8Z3U4_9BACT|nr:hypothetical protein CWM47_23545 [Spirosoma pollinicola]